MPPLVDIPAPTGASEDAAAAQAAHDALVGLFPAQASVFDLELKASLQGISDGDPKTAGIMVGQAAAQNMLAMRANDGSDKMVDYTPGTNPGDWQPTPPAYGPPLFPQWPMVTPFCLQSAAQFRPPPPPALTSPEYTAAFNLTKELGSFNSTTRNADQTEAVLFWQGIATPNSGPVGLWNKIAQEVAAAQGNTLVQNARLFALLDLALGDLAIACWDAKYTYNFWRPVTAIRAADTDGNADTDPDPNWTTLLNTPSHPSYPSAHSTEMGGAAVVVATYFGSDPIPFSLSWEGLPGVTRSFDSFSAAAHEAGMSRIWAGIHWSFDITAGEALGQSVGTYVFQNFLLPRASSPPAPRAASIILAVKDLSAAEAVRTTGLLTSVWFAPGDLSLPANTVGAGLHLGQAATYASPMGPTSNSVVSDTGGLEEGYTRSSSVQPQILRRSADDVFGSDGPWEGPFSPATWLTDGV